MNEITYLADIKAKYEIEKSGSNSIYLSKPSPAVIKNLCLKIYKSCESRIDKEILKDFFDLKGDDNDKKIIKQFDTDKLRPICNFFNGKTEVPKPDIYDLMALLVDYQPRPLNKYLRRETEEKSKTEEIEKPSKSVNEVIDKDLSNPNTSITTEPTKTWLQKHQKVVLISSIVLLTLFLIYFNTRKNEAIEWMEWVNNHYEVIDWDGKSNKEYRVIIPKDDNLLQNFRKIIPCNTTKFERNGRVCLWYGKSATGEVEFFTTLHYHPETGKSLKEVTSTIMNKYGKGPCK